VFVQISLEGDDSRHGKDADNSRGIKTDFKNKPVIFFILIP
jgi:hypothetical protein